MYTKPKRSKVSSINLEIIIIKGDGEKHQTNKKFQSTIIEEEWIVQLKGVEQCSISKF